MDGALVKERNGYLHELKSALEEVELLILRLPYKAHGDECKHQLLRQIHTIKGVAGSYGMELIAQAAHRVEDLLVGEIGAVEGQKNYIDQLLAQNDRLVAFSEAYLCGDSATLHQAGCFYDGKKAGGLDTAGRRDLDRVLIVEPSAATLQLCIQVLSGFGAVRVSSARDGYEALGWLLKEPFHAMVTSLQVPLIDGQSLTAVLRTVPGPTADSGDSFDFRLRWTRTKRAQNSLWKRVEIYPSNCMPYSPDSSAGGWRRSARLPSLNCRIPRKFSWSTTRRIFTIWCGCHSSAVRTCESSLCSTRRMPSSLPVKKRRT